MLKYFKNVSFLFQLMFLLFSSIIFSQSYSNSSAGGLTSILSENGLSQNTVHDILQDSRGFIWFATEDGLNKYDGYNFTVYKNDLKDKNSISDNFIWTIYEDRSGTIWIGTNSGGLCKFDMEKERFISYKNIPDDPKSLTLNNVRAIFEDNEGNIWVGTERGLDKFDRAKKVFTHYKNNPNDPHSLSNNVVLSIFEDKDEDLWIGSDGGLDKFDKKNNKFFNYSFKRNNYYNLSSVVLSIYQDRSGIMWIGTLKGLLRFDKKTKNFSHYLMNASESNSINNNRINSILEDAVGTLWIGTGEGLFQFNKMDEYFSKLSADRQNTNLFISFSDELNNNNVLSLYEDNSGLIWIGTAENGIIKYDRERTKFRIYNHNPFNSYSLSQNTIRALYQDDEGILWIGTLGGGLNRFDPEKNQFIRYKNNPKDKFSLSDNSISAICKDKFGYLWIGTWGGGLNRTSLPYKNLAKESQVTSSFLRFINYKHDQSDINSISNNIIQSVYEDSEGNLWIGTGTGLNLYDREKNNFISFVNNPDYPYSLSSNQVQSCILEDRAGNLWIGTWDGLNKFSFQDRKAAMINPSSAKFKHFRFQETDLNSLSDNRVISVFEDDESNLWFGTYGGGLNLLSIDQQNKSNEKFINYTIKDGLPSNIIYAIQGDDNGNLWLSTDNGLSMFNHKLKTFRNFDVSDGLQGNQFFWGASLKGKNGELFFGGTNGFNAFNPAELKNNEHIPPVFITNFQIFNKQVEINNDSPLSKAISFTKRIELPYSENVFSFEFAALDYTAPGKNKYAYKMDGFDNDWIYSGGRRFVTYTNLDPGEYIFRVKGSNNDGIWNEKGTSLVIKILPPLWRTWWFISSAILLIGGIIILIIYFRIKNLLDIERLRIKLAADLHDNIGSSLTEISILSEVISKKIKTEEDDVRKSLSLISNNSRNLIDNMSDIVWLVNPKRDSLYDLILRLRDSYSELSSYKSISFKSENIKSLEKVSLSMEHRQHLYLIFKEAINNSITHSCCTEITLDAFVKGSKLQMILKDNGKGFTKNENFNGNGLNHIKERAKII